MHAPLIDSRFGVLTRLDDRSIPAHFPPSFALTHSRISDISQFSAWPADRSGAGYAFANPHHVRRAAVGEGLERYCGSLVPEGLRSSTYNQLIAAGDDAVDPESLCLYSDSQLCAPGFPAVAFTRDLRVEWTPGTDLSTNTAVWVPAAMVWPSYFGSATFPPSPQRPLTNPIIQAGLAAGPDVPFARWGAICEIIERDAMTLSWYGSQGVHTVTVPRWLSTLAAGPVQALRPRFLSFTTEFGIPVIGTLIFDRSTGYSTLGMGVSPEPIEAAQKALGEALQLQLFVSEYDDPNSAFMRAAESSASPLKPWREDRRYGTSYRADRRDVVDYACHLQLHLDPDVQSAFDSELAERTLGTVDLSELTDVELADTAEHSDRQSALLQIMIARLRRAGRVVEVDVTTDDVARHGFRVVRNLVSGTYSNSALGLPFLGGARLASASSRAAARGTLAPATPLPH